MKLFRINILLLVLFFAGDTYASGFFLSQVGGPDSFPTEPNPAATFWNPAALGLIRDYELQLDIYSGMRYVNYKRDVGYEWNDDKGIWETKSGTKEEASLLNYIPLPFLGLSIPIKENVTLGFGVYSPFGSSSDWEDENGPQRYHSIRGGFNHIFLSPSLAYRFTRSLYGGITISYIRSLVESEKRLDLADLVGGLAEDPSIETTMKMDGFAGYAVAPQIGILFDQGRFRFGLSYQAKIPIKNRGLIIITPEGEKIRDIMGVADAKAEAEMRYTLPDVIKTSFDYYLKDSLRLRGYFEWVNWSRFDEIRFLISKRTSSLISDEITDEQYFRDAFGTRGQVKYWLKRDLAIYGGLGFDKNAIPDETVSASFVDSDKIASSFGIDTFLTRCLRMKVALQFIHFLPNDVEGSIRVPSANGEYNSEVVLLDLNLTYVKSRE